MSKAQRAFRVGTRKSRLAQVQTDLALQALGRATPGARFEVIGISTEGDRDRAAPIPDLGQGVFTKELEAALLTREIDLAVHSLKDMPTTLPPGLTLAAVLAREDPRDALVSQGNRTLDQLPPGARVGTGSPRRAAQVLARRPDLHVVLLRGNVDTRVAKVLEHDEADAAVLALAGLKRLGLEDKAAESFSPTEFIPAIGQGFLAIEAREDDFEALDLALSTQNQEARKAADAERALLAALGGGCKAPIGAYAVYQGGAMTMDAFVATLDGRRILRAHVEGQYTPEEAGRLIKNRLFAQGAEEIIREAEASSV